MQADRKLIFVSERLNRVIEGKGFVNRIQQFLEAPDNEEDLRKYAGEVDDVLREYEVMMLLPISHVLILINYAAVSTAGYIWLEPCAKSVASEIAGDR
jgi:hypothetical protein